MERQVAVMYEEFFELVNTKLGRVDASSVACGLAALAEYFEI